MNLQQRRVVVDTSVISHIFRQDEIGVQYRELLVGQQTLISFQTLAEQLQGAYSANWGQRRIEEFRSYLERYTVIWPDDDLVETYARVVADCSRTGWTIESADAWIAATAINLECSLATTDADFSGVPGLALLQRDV